MALSGVYLLQLHLRSLVNNTESMAENNAVLMKEVHDITAATLKSPQDTISKTVPRLLAVSNVS